VTGEIDWANYLQRFSTKVLWHFTGYEKSDDQALEILKAIISSNRLQISHKDRVVLMNDGKRRDGWGYASLADIPFKDLLIHAMRYGRYGISFSKKCAISAQFNPVLYVDRNHAFFKHAQYLLQHIDELIPDNLDLSKPSPLKCLNEYLYMIGTYVKASELSQPVKFDSNLDKLQKNNFYYEREWRSPYDWNLQAGDVHSILAPKRDLDFLAKFIKQQKAVVFEGVALLPFEHIEEL
jgi:hypothetical protein